MNKKATAALPAALFPSFSTSDTTPASHANMITMPVMQLRRSLRLPTRSMRNQGMKDAMKNHVKRTPEIRLVMLGSRPAAPMMVVDLGCQWAKR